MPLDTISAVFFKHCSNIIGSIPEGEQKLTSTLTCFARSALCTGNYDLYALVTDSLSNVAEILMMWLLSASL